MSLEDARPAQVHPLRQFAESFAELERELSGKLDVTAVLQVVTHLARDRVGGADFAGVTRVAEQQCTTIAPTDPVVERVDRIQYELGMGPCITAAELGIVVSAGDLRSDERWAQFGERAHDQHGIASMLCFRLFVEGSDVSAGLNLYSRRPHAFDESSEVSGLLFATHGALAFGRAEEKERSRNLEIALNNAREIGIAMGVIMNATKATRDQAFDLLRMASQHSQRKLSALAAEVADTGILPALPTGRPAGG